MLRAIEARNGRAEEQSLKRQGFSLELLRYLEAMELVTVTDKPLKAAGRQISWVTFIPDGQPLPKNKPALQRLDQWLQKQKNPVQINEAQKVVSNPKKQLAHLVALERAKITTEDKGPQISVPTFDEKVHAVNLTPVDQKHAVATLQPGLGYHQAFLLEGITGSGKLKFIWKP